MNDLNQRSLTAAARAAAALVASSSAAAVGVDHPVEQCLSPSVSSQSNDQIRVEGVSETRSSHSSPCL